MINPARIDFTTLHVYCAVARTGSITRGAAACHLALSAASRRLSEFESAAGTALLVRSAHGVALTPAGHMALQHALRLTQGYHQLGHELADYSRGVRGHVRLWANMSALTEFLPPLLMDFIRTHPDIRVDVEEQLSHDTVRAVVDGLADLGIFAGTVPADGLHCVPWRTDRLVLVCPRTHPLAAESELDFATCLDWPFVGLIRGSSLLDCTTRAAEAAGRTLALRVQVSSFDAVCRMVAAGLGIGVLPADAVRPIVQGLALSTVPLRDDWSHRTLMLAVRDPLQLAPAAEKLHAHLLGHLNTVE